MKFFKNSSTVQSLDDYLRKNKKVFATLQSPVQNLIQGKNYSILENGLMALGFIFTVCFLIFFMLWIGKTNVTLMLCLAVFCSIALAWLIVRDAPLFSPWAYFLQGHLMRFYNPSTGEIGVQLSFSYRQDEPYLDQMLYNPCFYQAIQQWLLQGEKMGGYEFHRLEQAYERHTQLNANLLKLAQDPLTPIHQSQACLSYYQQHNLDPLHTWGPPFIDIEKRLNDLLMIKKIQVDRLELSHHTPCAQASTTPSHRRL